MFLSAEYGSNLVVMLHKCSPLSSHQSVSELWSLIPLWQPAVLPPSSRGYHKKVLRAQYNIGYTDKWPGRQNKRNPWLFLSGVDTTALLIVKKKKKRIGSPASDVRAPGPTISRWFSQCGHLKTEIYILDRKQKRLCDLNNFGRLERKSIISG